MLTLVLVVLAFVPMIAEAALSARNERRLRAAGAIEPPGDVFAAMRIAYPACFAAILLEGWLRSAGSARLTVAGAAVFVAAKGLKYWAIASLGTRWTFRVLVPPKAGLVSSGPYRFLRHPNYAAVAGELLGIALMAAAPLAGTIAIVGFGGLMLARVRVEERALGREHARLGE